MKKTMISALIAGALACTMVGCDMGKAAGGAVTEQSDPFTIVSEKVDRTGWTEAFSAHENFSVKTVVKIDKTQNGKNMSETDTVVYRFSPNAVGLSLSVREGSKVLYETEGYLEVGEEVTFWQRGRESEDEWSEWDVENYAKQDLGELFGAENGLAFAKDNYANFSFSEENKGYTATSSGLAAMQEEIEAFSGSLVAVSGSDELLPLKSFVIKVNGGKPSACIVNLEAPAEALTEIQPRDSAESDETDGQGEDSERQDDADPDAPEQPEGPEQPEVKTKKITVTQVYFDYDETKVEKPASIPAPEKARASSTLFLCIPGRKF